MAHALLHFVGPKHIIQKIFILVSLGETPVAEVEHPLEVAVREAPVQRQVITGVQLVL